MKAVEHAAQHKIVSANGTVAMRIDCAVNKHNAWHNKQTLYHTMNLLGWIDICSPLHACSVKAIAETQ